MQIYFATKEENNLRREEDFLKLSPGERLMSFIEMVCTHSNLPFHNYYVHQNDKKGNYEINLKDEKEF
jgi:hypothetical protein